MAPSEYDEATARQVVKYRDRVTKRTGAIVVLVIVAFLAIGLVLAYEAIKVREEVSRQADRDRTELIEEMQRQARIQHERTLELNREHDRQIQRQLNVIQKTIRDIVKRAGGDVSRIPRVVDGRAPPDPSPPSPDGGPGGGDKPPPDQVKAGPSPTPSCVPAGRSDNCIPQKGKKP